MQIEGMQVQGTEPGYAILLRASWQLWWRYWVVTLGFWVLLALPVVAASAWFPLVWEAWRMSRATQPEFLAVTFLVYNLLVCYPLAVRWLRRGGHALLAAGDFPHEPNPTRRQRERQGFLLAWAVFWLPLLWDVANLGLMGLLLTIRPGHERLVPALVVMGLNAALVTLFAVLPWNVRWAVRHSLWGARWRLLPH